MKTLLFGYLLASMLLLVSCQKEDLQPTSIEQDYRNQLIGTYTGKVEFEDIVHDKDSDKAKKGQELIPNQSIEISKAQHQADGLLMNGNLLNMVSQSVDNKNHYGDVFIYLAQDCVGSESYTLEFYPKKNHLVLEYKHNRGCNTETLKQNYYFRGIKDGIINQE